MLMYCDLCSKGSKIEQQTGLLLANFVCDAPTNSNLHDFFQYCNLKDGFVISAKKILCLIKDSDESLGPYTFAVWGIFIFKAAQPS